MTDLTLLVTILLNVGLAFSKGISIQCQNVPERFCGRGQFVVYAKDSGYSCVDCPTGTFMDFDNHACESCKNLTQPNPREIIIQHGNSTADNVVVCVEGFFRPPGTPAGLAGKCERCSVCEQDSWAARKCAGELDTFCCKHGMVAVHLEEDGLLTCTLQHSRRPRHLQQLRKERSSGGHEHNVTEDNSDGGSLSEGIKVSGDESHSNPNHDYSRADYETEYQHNKVEFPIWARILCAGVAVGVFLFYLGVGIPCNACGSRDKLRELRKRICEHTVTVPREEETTEKPTAKPTSSSDQV